MSCYIIGTFHKGRLDVLSAERAKEAGKFFAKVCELGALSGCFDAKDISMTLNDLPAAISWTE